MRLCVGSVRPLESRQSPSSLELPCERGCLLYAETDRELVTLTGCCGLVTGQDRVLALRVIAVANAFIHILSITRAKGMDSRIANYPFPG